MKCNIKNGKVVKYNSGVLTRKEKYRMRQKELCSTLDFPEYDPKVHGKSFFRYLYKYALKRIEEKDKK